VDKAKVSALERQLADAQVKQQNLLLEQSFAETQRVYAQAYTSLLRLKNEAPEEQFERAKNGLQRGDAADAETFFSGVAQNSTRSGSEAAEAAFQLGELPYLRCA
jgi:hypothetical protein